MPTDRFVATSREKLRRIKIGCSFAPELYQLGGSDNPKTPEQALVALKMIVEQFGLRDMRLGIRWSRAVDQNGAVDLSFYQPVLDYCLKSDLPLCLNVGPIKTFRWPEQHVPDSVLRSLSSVPAKGATIYPQMEIAKAALDYLDRLLAKLEAEYGPDLTSKLKVVQPENEPFIPFGQFEWVMSEAYLEDVIALIRSYLPAQAILLNSGALQVIQMSRFCRQVLATHQDLRGKLVYGYDFFYEMGDGIFSSIPLLDRVDMISFYQMLGIQAYPHDLPGITTEVTEGQMEPWGKFTAPGNSVKHLRYLILRCIENALNLRTGTSAVLRVWGIEQLTEKFFNGTATQQHRQMVELMSTINGLS